MKKNEKKLLIISATAAATLAVSFVITNGILLLQKKPKEESIEKLNQTKEISVLPKLSININSSSANLYLTDLVQLLDKEINITYYLKSNEENGHVNKLRKNVKILSREYAKNVLIDNLQSDSEYVFEISYKDQILVKEEKRTLILPELLVDNTEITTSRVSLSKLNSFSSSDSEYKLFITYKTKNEESFLQSLEISSINDNKSILNLNNLNPKTEYEVKLVSIDKAGFMADVTETSNFITKATNKPLVNFDSQENSSKVLLFGLKNFNNQKLKFKYRITGTSNWVETESTENVANDELIFNLTGLISSAKYELQVSTVSKPDTLIEFSGKNTVLFSTFPAPLANILEVSSFSGKVLFSQLNAYTSQKVYVQYKKTNEMNFSEKQLVDNFVDDFFVFNLLNLNSETKYDVQLIREDNTVITSIKLTTSADLLTDISLNNISFDSAVIHFLNADLFTGKEVIIKYSEENSSDVPNESKILIDKKNFEFKLSNLKANTFYLWTIHIGNITLAGKLKTNIEKIDSSYTTSTNSAVFNFKNDFIKISKNFQNNKEIFTNKLNLKYRKVGTEEYLSANKIINFSSKQNYSVTLFDLEPDTEYEYLIQNEVEKRTFKTVSNVILNGVQENQNIKISSNLSKFIGKEAVLIYEFNNKTKTITKTITQENTEFIIENVLPQTLYKIILNIKTPVIESNNSSEISNFVSTEIGNTELTTTPATEPLLFLNNINSDEWNQKVDVTFMGFGYKSSQSKNIFLKVGEDLSDNVNLQSKIYAVSAEGNITSGAYSLESDKTYKASLYNKDGEQLGNILTFTTPKIPKLDISLEIIDNNTNNPKFKIKSNIDLNKNFRVRMDKINSESDYKELTDSNRNNFEFNHSSRLKWTVYLAKDKEYSFSSLLNYNQFELNAKYQFIISDKDDAKKTVFVTTPLESSVIFGTKTVIDKSILKKPALKDNFIRSKNFVNLTFINLDDYKTNEDSLDLYYVEKESSNYIFNPQTSWKKYPKKIFSNTTNNEATITITNLKKSTEYAIALINKKGETVYRTNNIFTIRDIELYISTFGNDKMNFSIRHFQGHNSLYGNSYKMIYSKDSQYNLESNVVNINENNSNNTFIFQVGPALESGTLYNYKIVNSVTGELLNDFQGTFRTQNDQHVLISDLRHDGATLLFSNPYYKLRELQYFDVRQNGNSVALKFQYSTNESFSEEDTEEFTLGLNENNSNLLPIILNELKNNTKYFYKIMKLENNIYVDVQGLQGSFITLSKNAFVKTIDNIANIVLKDVIAADQNKFRVEYSESQNGILSWHPINEGVFSDNELVFTAKDLLPSTYYNYKVIDQKNEIVSSGSFKSKESLSKLDISDEVVSSNSQRIILKNMDDYLNDEITIKYKKVSATEWISKKVKLADDNNTIMWDLIDLEANTQYEYKVEYVIPYYDQISILKNATPFTTANVFDANGAKISTKVRTYSNYDHLRYTTVTSLQEMYANETNWQDIIKKSIKEILINGNNVEKTGWHVIDDSLHYFENTKKSDNLKFKYIWNDNNKIKGLSFEFVLIGNLIKLKVLEAKFANLNSNPLAANWEQLTENMGINSFSYSYGMVNKSSSLNFLMLGGLKFDFETIKRKSSDISVPQIFRYSMDATEPTLFPGGISNYTSFFNIYAEGVSANMAPKKAKLLPFTSHFAPAWNTVEDSLSSELFVPGVNPKNSFYKIMDFLDQDKDAKIKFTGSYQNNQNWQKLHDNKNIIYSDYSTFAHPIKGWINYLVKRIIYKENNKLIGMQLSIGNDWGFDGATYQRQFGLPDLDNIYEKNIDKNTDLSSITWDNFYQGSKKIALSTYMSPDSPGYNVSGFSFESRDLNLISENYKKWNNSISRVELTKQISENSENLTNKPTEFVFNLSNLKEGDYVISYKDFSNLDKKAEQNFVISTAEEALNKKIVLIPTFTALQYLVSIYKKDDSEKTEIFSEIVAPLNVILSDKTSGNIGVTTGKNNTYRFPVSILKDATQANWKNVLSKYVYKVRLSGDAYGINQNEWFKFTLEKNDWSAGSEAPEYIAAGTNENNKLIMTKLVFSWGNDGYIYIRNGETRWYQMSGSETFDTVDIPTKYDSSTRQTKPYVSSSDTNVNNASVITGLILKIESSLKDYKLDNPSEFDTDGAKTAKFSLKLMADAGTYKIGYQKVGSSDVETKAEFTVAQNSNSYIYELNIANANKNESYAVNLYKEDGTTLLSTMYVHTPTIFEATSSSAKKGIGSNYDTSGTNGFVLQFNTLLKGFDKKNYKNMFKQFFAETRNSGTAINSAWTSDSNLGEWTSASNSVYDANNNNPEYIAAAKNHDNTKWILTRISLGWYTQNPYSKMQPKTVSVRYANVTDENKNNPNIGELYREAVSTENTPYTSSDTIDNTANKVVVTGIKFYKKSFNE